MRPFRQIEPLPLFVQDRKLALQVRRAIRLSLKLIALKADANFRTTGRQDEIAKQRWAVPKFPILAWGSLEVGCFARDGRSPFQRVRKWLRARGLEHRLQVLLDLPDRLKNLTKGTAGIQIQKVCTPV